MLTHPTLDQLRALRLEGMARALEEQHAHPAPLGQDSCRLDRI